MKNTYQDNRVRRTQRESAERDSRGILWQRALPLASMLISVAVAITSFYLTYKSITQANRAWIGLNGPIKIDGFQSAPEWAVAAHYTIENFGHGPALKVTASSFVVTDPKQLDSTAKFVCDATEHFTTGTVPTTPAMAKRNPGPLGRILFPGQVADENLASEGMGIGKTGVWHGSEIPDPPAFWVVGCVAYMDQFKSSHWTKFCMRGNVVNGGVSELAYCNLYNDTDETGREMPPRLIDR
jgi:hypothetical protein